MLRDYGMVRRMGVDGMKKRLADAAVLAGILLLILCGGAESLRAIVLCGAAGCVLIGAGAAALEKDGD